MTTLVCELQGNEFTIKQSNIAIIFIGLVQNKEKRTLLCCGKIEMIFCRHIFRITHTKRTVRGGCAWTYRDHLYGLSETKLLQICDDATGTKSSKVIERKLPKG